MRLLKLASESDVDMDRVEDARIQISRIIPMLVHDGAPKLEELYVNDLALSTNVLMQLGEAIGQGKSPALSSLVF